MASSRLEDEFKNLWERFLLTCKPVRKTKEDGTEIIIVEDELAYEAIGYIIRQLNDATLLADLNNRQYEISLTDAILDYNILVYIKHYKPGMPVVENDPLYTSGVNIMRLMFSRVLGGKDRQLEIENIRAKAPPQIVMKQ